jgi:hypothetical protein
MEGKAMRTLMSAFDARKKAFKNDPRPFGLVLPAPLNNLNTPEVNNGQITITRYVFKNEHSVPD